MNDTSAFLHEVEEIGQKLFAYCRNNHWAGHDPYDALNSSLLDVVPLLNFRLPRLVLTQVLKRSPVNVRGLLRVPKSQNPKALALFLTALLRAPCLAPVGRDEVVDQLTEQLLALRSPEARYWSWGYSFPWQTRTELVPRWSPNLVCTSFVAEAFLDLYDRRADSRYLSIAVSGAEYILDQLYWCRGSAIGGFSYPLPSVRNQVHNANLLAAALFLRVYAYTGERRFLTPALTAARYSVAQQRADGSWAYGEAPSQQWIDNFHTGYNLCALRKIGNHLHSGEFAPAIARGFNFFKKHFLREDGAVRYFHDRTYPIDIHCVAQSIITLEAFRDVDPGCLTLASRIFWWARANMWNDDGFFAYRKLRGGTIWISYMRWSQAWMVMAMASLLNGVSTMSDQQGHPSQRLAVEAPSC
jgi:hypothetical protein